MFSNRNFFSDQGFADIPIADGELSCCANWLSPSTASLYLRALRRRVEWQQSTIRIAGKWIKIPRLNAWYGDADAHYRYSGKDFAPLPWIRPLQLLRQRLRRDVDIAFNSALVNCYRDGRDSVSWHADDEKELGLNPVIASLSLGAERRFVLKHKFDRGQAARELLLPHGSLLLMSGPLQHNWVHSLPKTAKPVGERINVTFRVVGNG